MLQSGGTILLTDQSVFTSAGARILGQDVELRAAGLVNDASLLQAENNLTITLGSGALTNRNSGSAYGLIAKNGTLAITAGAVNNDTGYMAAGSHFTATVSSWNNGSGKVASLGDFSLTSGGALQNRGTLSAKGNMTLTGSSLSQSASGEITADGNLRVSVGQTIDNRGLLDSGFTWLTASTINNVGTGRIYGDHVSLGASTVINSYENAGGGFQAGVIASRGRLDIGAGTLYNLATFDSQTKISTAGLILSLGDMYVGGSLDGSGKAVGQGGGLLNNGATIEALGNMSLSMGSIQNLNVHLALEKVTTGPTPVYEVSWSGIGQNIFSGNKTVVEDVVSEYVPGIIRSGGSMTLSAGGIHNKDSQILAGGNLSILGAAVTNEATTGTREENTQGTLTFITGSHIAMVPSSSSHTSTIDLTFQGEALAVSKAYTNRVQGGSTGQNPADGSVSNVLQATAAAPAGMPQWSSGPNAILPQNSLYQINKDPAASVLIETDSRFTKNHSYLSSAYLLSRLNGAPGAFKFLGDGFYEQSLLRNQISQIAGQRFLNSYLNDEDQYRGLMDAGAAFGNKYNLQAGVALSPEQQALLTEDIVWVVEQDVPLPDGGTSKVLVPKFYSHLAESDLMPAGGLIASDKDLDVSAAIVANSGRMIGRETLNIDADTIQNSGQLQGGMVLARTEGDFIQKGGKIVADQGIALDIGRDLLMESTTRSSEIVGLFNRSSNTDVDRISSMEVRGSGGIIDIQAAGKIGLYGAQITNGINLAQGQELTDTGSYTRLAANSIDLGTVDTGSSSFALYSKGFVASSTQSEYGSTIVGAGDVVLKARDGDINIRGSAIASGDSTTLSANQGSIRITPGWQFTDSTVSAKNSTSSGLQSTTSGFFSHEAQSQGLSSVVTAKGDVYAQAKDTIEVRGSMLYGETGTYLEADHILNIADINRTVKQTLLSSSSTGVSASGGSVTFGNQSSRLNQSGTYTSTLGSVIGALDSNVVIIAHEDYLQKGSDLYYGDLYLKAKQAKFLAQENPYSEISSLKTSQSGLTLQVSNPIVSAGMQVWDLAQNMGRTSSATALAAGVLGMGLTGHNAYSGYALGRSADPFPNAKSPLQGTGLGNALGQAGSVAGMVGGININLSYGSQQSTTNKITVGSNQTGSFVYGDRAVLDIGDKDNPNALALQIQGSDVLASDSLYARIIGNVDISSAVDTRVERGNSKSSGYTTGVGVSFAGDGVTVSAQTSAFASKGNSSGTDLENHYSHFGGQNLTVFDISGDLNMLGGVIIGDRIAGKIGGDLTIVSPQDISIYRSQQTSGSVGASIGWNLTTWSPRGGINASVSQENVKSNTVSVGDEKAGIKAGDGGFNITVGGGTHLTGAAISSSQEAVDKGLNYFSTNGLWIADLLNKSSSNASSTSMSLGYSPGSGFKGLTGGVPVVMSSSDSDQSTTVAGISGGTIINNGQETAVDSTGRPIDTAVRTGDASGKVENVLDLDKINSEFAIGKTLSQEAGTFLNYRAQEADKEKDDAKKRLKDEQDKGAQADPAKLIQYQQEVDAPNPWGPGGTSRLVFTAVTSALSGNMSGSAAQAMQSAVVTTIQGLGAQEIKKALGDTGDLKTETLRTALQAIVGCAGAAASGGSCGAGALGASASVVINNLVDLATNTTGSKLTAQEKEARMNLLNSLVGGVTAALGGDAAAAVLAARVEQEDNANMNLFNEKKNNGLWKQTNAWNRSDYYTISGHGTPSHVEDANSKHLTPGDLEALIRADTNWGNKPIFLDACSTGKGDNSFAQELANRLGVIVVAPTDDVSFNFLLGYKYGRSIDNKGEDKFFWPKRKNNN
ncbi:MAG: hemagglutinin repeat-containing protein [Solidesulfovibrio sp.]